ncbi:MAG TPA: NmrA/HSCARG family protein [Polyangiaceae bacterium]|nr:NmrA/HSCARG family protein [Polyangiaceae bacterium]
MATDQVVLVTGATGQQGGATIRHLAQRGGFKLRGMTRNPDGNAAKALASLGVELVRGDLDDTASLDRALSGAWGVYAVQNTWEAGVEKEEEQGKRIATLACERGVQHFVYASVASADKATGIPHFDNKGRVEQAVKQLGFPSHTIVRPAFFMENLLSPMFLQGDSLLSPLSPATKLQMVAVDDIGRFGAQAFIDASKWSGAEVDFAGDAVTMSEAAEAVGEILGRTITAQPIPIEAVRQNSDDLALMFEWFERVGYSADIAGLEAKWGIRPLTTREWARAKKGG